MRTVALLSVLVLVGCLPGGDDAGEEVPADFAVQSGDDYTFAYPSSWAPDPEDTGDFDVRFYGPEPDGGGAPPLVMTFDAPGYPGGQVPIAEYAEVFNDAQDINTAERTVLDEGDADVDGADEAYRVDAEYETAFRDGPVRVRDTTILSVADGTAKISLRVICPVQDYEAWEEEIEQIVASFRVGTGPGGA